MHLVLFDETEGYPAAVEGTEACHITDINDVCKGKDAKICSHKLSMVAHDESGQGDCF